MSSQASPPRPPGAEALPLPQVQALRRVALAVAHPAAAAGKLVYARYADSLLLDPVFNDANVDIWITTNLYDTLFLPTDDGKDVQPGLATAWQAADDGMSYTIKLREGVKFAGRLAVSYFGRCRQIGAASTAMIGLRHMPVRYCTCGGGGGRK